MQLLGDAVLIRGPGVLHALVAVAGSNRTGRLRNGKTPHPTAVDLEAALTAAARRLHPDAVSAGGRVDVHHTADDSGFECDRIDAAAAADILGCTRRHVYRIAPTLGGRRHAGRWMFDRPTVVAHTLET